MLGLWISGSWQRSSSAKQSLNHHKHRRCSSRSRAAKRVRHSQTAPLKGEVGHAQDGEDVCGVRGFKRRAFNCQVIESGCLMVGEW